MSVEKNDLVFLRYRRHQCCNVTLKGNSFYFIERKQRFLKCIQKFFTPIKINVEKIEKRDSDDPLK